MTEQQKLDLNISNWSVLDLYELFNIPKDARTTDVARIADKVIQKQTEGEIKYFLELARNKIIKHQQDDIEGDMYQEDTDRQLKEWWRNQYLTSGDAEQANKATIRDNKVEIFDDENGHMQMKENRLGVTQTHSLPHVQGTINPVLRTEIERFVVLDSQYRSNIFPYAYTDIASPSFNTDFTVTLSENLTNVTEISLESINIPKTWYNFDTFLGNTCFAIVNKELGGRKTLIQIDPGNYNGTQLKNEINRLLYEGGGGPSIDLSFNYNESRNRFSFTWNDVTSDSTVGYDIYFYTPALFQEFIKDTTACKGCIDLMYPNNSLGWDLGWRRTPDVDSYVKITLDTSSVPVYGDAAPTLEKLSSLMIILDDFNKNRLNTGIIGASLPGTKLDVPDYINLNNIDCSGDNFFSKVAPRQLTQAQLYTLNSILADRREKKNRLTAPTTADALAVVPVYYDGRASGSDSGSESIVLMSNQLNNIKRKYFGPVSIERFRARLVDDKGNLVNLNGRDWSFTLRIKQLYQY